jgi:hypothetical protein
MRRIFKFFSLTILSLIFVNQIHAQDISETLSHIKGLTVKEVSPSPNPLYRVFELKYMQPEDHFTEGSPEFSQRLVLWHLKQVGGETRPMVLQTSGYAIFSLALSALASEFNANQIQVEHRFFADSVPASKNWKLDNIQQSAADFHHIVEALKPVYAGKWVNTGRSKGGMTSLYHRYFYPDDLAATVAHVAPHSYSLGDETDAYAVRLADTIGGEANKVCRANLLESQKVLLSHKDQILTRINGDFALLGSKEIGLEHSIIELPWTYWQYSGPGEDCSNVPAPDAPIDDHINFLFENNDPNGYNDTELAGFVPYYFQASTQLGNPGTRLTEIASLLNFKDTFNIKQYVPDEIELPYDNAVAMHEVSDWLKTKSTQMIFVYGGFDPWTGGAHPAENFSADRDTYRFDVAGMNHGAQFLDLKGEAHELAYTKIRQWLNINAEMPPLPPAMAAAMKDAKLRRSLTLETKEFNFREPGKVRRRKL